MDQQHRAEERHRIAQALKQLVTLRGKLYVEGSILTGTFGSLMQRELNLRFQRGPKHQTNPQLVRWFEQVYHHQKRIVSAMAIAHRRPIQISGPLAEWKPWGKIRQRMRLDTHLGAKAQLAIGIGSCGIRPTWSFKPGQIPGLAAIPSSHFSVYCSETNHLDPVVVVERHGSVSADGSTFITRRVWVWDLRNPERPRYECHPSEDAFWSQTSWGPIEKFNDDLYPWRRADGQPVIPWSFYQGQPDAQELLPVTQLAEDTWQLMIRLTWATFPEVIRGWDIPMPYGEKKIQGLEHSVARPHAYVPIHGEGIHGVALAPSAVPSVLARLDIWRQKVAMAADRYDRRLHVVDRKDSASGIALEIEASQEHAAYDDQETRWASEDAAAIDHWRMTWNTWVRWGLLAEEEIPEGDIQVSYQRYFTPAARLQQIAQERQAMIDGPGSPVRYHMARMGMDPKDSRQREIAAEQLVTIREERAAFADMLPKQTPSISITGASAPPEAP